MIGTLRERVVIQAATTTADAIGAPVQSWSTLATVWARVEPLAGREAYAAQQVMASAAYRVRVRYRADVTPKNRLTWGGRTLEILSAVNEHAAGQYLDLLCGEVTT